jgi:hypothetical protein
MILDVATMQQSDIGRYRVLLDGKDVTDRATYADDTEGRVDVFLIDSDPLKVETGGYDIPHGSLYGQVEIIDLRNDAR